MFVSCKGPKKNRVGMSLKKKKLYYFLGLKCVFYACFTLIGSWEGGKNFRVGFFLKKKIVRVGLQETNNFFFRPINIVHTCTQSPNP